MSITTTTTITTSSHGSSVPQHLRATKEILQDAAHFAKIATTLDNAEFDVLEQDAFEVLRLIRSWRNAVAPINRIPPEILGLIPDFWDTDERDEDIIALTHVCGVWRGVFTSRPSLWTRLDPDGMNGDKTRVYLERSKSFPLSLSLHRGDLAPPSDPFFRIIPRVIGRLGYLFIGGTPENIQNITAHLSRPAPLLEDLTIFIGSQPTPRRYPVLTSTLFAGDLSSLRKLDLVSVHTELPWRNMANLTMFTLRYTPPGGISTSQLLDFFESAPHLREVELELAIPTSGAQNGRLVSLSCLEVMRIIDRRPPSVLLDHLLIPVGAELMLEADFLSSLVSDLPRSLDNLRNFSNFTAIKLYIDKSRPRMTFSGPNGRVSLTFTGSRVNKSSLLLKSLTQLDTSRTERFRIEKGESPSGDLVRRALLPMKDLRVLVLCECDYPYVFIHALHPSMSPSEVLVCPDLEELVIVLRNDGEAFDMEDAIGMAEARASRGKKLKSVRVVHRGDEPDPQDVLELTKHVRHVEHGPRINAVDDDW